MNRPRKNPNRWMINYIPVMREKQPIDWSTVFLFVELALVVAYGIAYFCA